jgi:hypothetical protein
VSVQRFSHSAFRWSVGRASGRIVASSRSKKTSPSGRSALSWSSDFFAKISSSVSGARRRDRQYRDYADDR